MIYTKNQLLEILEKYDDHDFLVGELWSKLDVDDRISEIKEDPDGYEVDPASLDRFNSYNFWDDYSGEFDGIFDRSISYNYDTMLDAIVDHLKEN